ncbi:Porphobilinogen synthase [Alkaliphilus metalliredigens QYMF]|uniref:Delta-aminolevulinic acid dehydratase n=1 Tax=Alkaliphilus metalliredigens (strain QYMF) TaxID=293826 RepID=A6TJD7_ALKMQ|nr:porphobilinogen synthase [Alkaliphilus metalliredigens]ABR46305.1 Porphobilinogen synthase [Alkaliphilus metalliredigens QYMF]
MDLIQRPRRLRGFEAIRNIVRETTVNTSDLIYPIFVVHGEKIKREISALPGQYHLSVDMLAEEIEEISALGIQGIMIFGIPKTKDEAGSEAYHTNGIVQQAVKEVKKHRPSLLVMTDVCLCQYADHGHCGIIQNGRILNDRTLDVLANIALSHAEAGADVVAPSDMMDGRVKRIREVLDHNDFEHIPILSYSVKYASAFYGPFRSAAGSSPQFGDRKTYQMDTGNRRESLREVALDIEEGADMVMVKPALAYLDIIREVKDKFQVPLGAYQVSGEYAMIKQAAQAGLADETQMMVETLTSIKRAGADIILTYFAKEMAKWIRDQ